MSCRAVIAVKAPGQGKSRLATVLDPAARRNLVRAMLARVTEAARSARNVDQVCILGPSRHGLAESLILLADEGLGLNAALGSALAELRRAGVSRAVFIAGDLPKLTARDVERLAGAPAGAIAIAPDRRRTGTNALSLPLPEAANFTFAFGLDSFARHQREAQRLNLKCDIVQTEGLAHDVDKAEDLRGACEVGSNHGKRTSQA